jgi:hypothetical protein
MILKRLLIAAVIMTSSTVYSQYNTDWYFPGVSNSVQSGFIGIGTSTATNGLTPLPNYNFHVHGDVDYISSNIFNGIIPNDPKGGLGIGGGAETSINYGVTSRIGLTNSMTGKSDMEGTVLQMSQLDFSLKNQALGDLTLSVPDLTFKMSNSTKRAWLGGTLPTTSSTYGKMNIVSSDNGLFIQTHNTLRYGMRIKMAGNDADAIQVFGQGSTGTKNFKVSGDGEVFARKYTTTLNNIPDYVFDPSYELMPLSDLRTYVAKEHHLPNVPSAEEYTSAPVDLGEMNRLLLEKVEELTLYILEMEARVNTLEKNN